MPRYYPENYLIKKGIESYSEDERRLIRKQLKKEEENLQEELNLKLADKTNKINKKKSNAFTKKETISIKEKDSIIEENGNLYEKLFFQDSVDICLCLKSYGGDRPKALTMVKTS